MKHNRKSALPIVLALLVGLGAGAALRARGGGADHEDHIQPAAEGQTLGDSSPTLDEPSFAIDLANDACPMMGGETDGAVFTHWNGLRVQLCCPSCEEEFLADPESALSAAGVDATGALEAISELRASSGPERERLLSTLSSRFHVVEVKAGEGVR